MEESRLVVAIDCDDVIVPTAFKVIDYYRTRHKFDVDPARFYDGEAEDWGAPDKLTVHNRIERYFRKNSQELVTPFPGAVEAISRLALAHELHLVTGRSNFMKSTTDEMVNEHFPDCFDSIVHTNYFKNRFRRTKGQVCRDLGVHVLVDDHMDHGVSVLEEGIEDVIVFGDYPWNRNRDLMQGMVRCEDWTSTQKEVSKIATRKFSLRN